jgi:hypothetical protein
MPPSIRRFAMLIRLDLCVLALATAAGSFETSAHASVIVETARRTVVAYAGGQSETRHHIGVGAVTHDASAEYSERGVLASVTHHSVISNSGMSGAASLSQRGLDELSAPTVSYMGIVWIDNVMTFVVDSPTPYTMEVSTLSSTWDVVPLYGLIIAAGAWSSPDDGGISYVDLVVQPTSGTAVSQGVLAPGRYTAFYRFTTAYFGPNTVDLSTASLSYSLTIPAPGSAMLLAFGGVIAARRRR